jgi:AcrR family transcriptional regulator
MSAETRQAILDAAIDQISRSGEASVRLRDIAKIVGVKEPSIYYYFANREELVVAAHVRRFEINLSQTLQPFIELLAQCSTSAEFVDGLKGLYQASFSPVRTISRAARAEIVGGAYLRPDLQRELSAMAQSMFQPALELMNKAKVAGWIRPSLDIEAFIYWNLAAITGLLFPEVLANEKLLDTYHGLLIESVVSMVRGVDEDH